MDSTQLRTTCAQNGVELSDEQLQLLAEYAALLLEWNNKINLISRRDGENFWERHILHCISLVFKVELPDKAKVLDLGSGGGLPGVVLKIVRPDLSFTLLDSTQKKLNVVKKILSSLDLAGIDTVWGRAEDIGRQRGYMGQYDIVVARAVGALKDLALWSYPFLKKRTPAVDPGEESNLRPAKTRIAKPSLVAFKGGDLESEIKQLKNQSIVGPISTIELTLKGSTQLDDRDKKIVVVEFM